MTSRVVIFDRFDTELEASWHHLENATDAYVFQTYDWNKLWLDCIGRAKARITPCVAVAFNGDAPVALFPFGLRRTYGITLLELLGGDQSDYLSPLIHVDALAGRSVAALWAEVAHALPRHDAFVFTKVPGKINDVPNEIVGVWPSKPSHEAYAATLPARWEEMTARLPSRLRNDSRRQRRRLSEKANLRFAIATTKGDHDCFLEAMFEQKRRRYRETGARDVLAEPAVREFYRKAGVSLTGSSVQQLSALLCNGIPAATHWGLVYRSRYYWLMPTYASGEFARFSPGRLLQEDVMRWAIEQGLRHFDFTVGGEDYKKLWCDTHLVLFNALGYRSLAGALFIMVHRIRDRLKANGRFRRLAMNLVRLWRLRPTQSP